MQFQVPQFIDVEDKIFGPLTFKQFIYILGGAGATFIVYKIIPSAYLAIAIASPIILLALALAFYKYNDRPFIFMIESAFRYLMSSKLFLWKKTEGQSAPGAKTKEEQVVGLPSLGGGLLRPGGGLPRPGGGLPRPGGGPRMTGDKLKDLSWSLDVHEKITK